VKTKGIIGLYSGCMALVVGNTVKAGVRFVSYDYFKSLLADPQVTSLRRATRTQFDSPFDDIKGKVSAPRSLLGMSSSPGRTSY
jgi:Mitochondrial carrier protein